MSHKTDPVEQQFPQPTIRADALPARHIDVYGYEALEVPQGFTFAGLLARIEALEAKAHVEPDPVNETEAEVEAVEDAKTARGVNKLLGKSKA